jgi:hypothetical protein
MRLFTLYVESLPVRSSRTTLPHGLLEILLQWKVMTTMRSLSPRESKLFIEKY